ncbi:hypothetical protein RDI58_000904 [Solanum bulbocastanum]|uniref:Uncharacterized protein n=1 Tax=Solanum bulbocastanum TaxID=147425 RepID=A0AAN8UAZ6_SOLBU
MLQYGNIVVEYVEPGCSDHTPIEVNTGASQIKVKKPFKLLNVVMKQQAFKDLVISAWNQQYLIEEEREKLKMIENWEEVHEKILRQQSRVVWIQQGDRNSKYFYAVLKAKKARNQIAFIYNEQGRKFTDPKLIQEEFVTFFKTLLGQTTNILPTIIYNIWIERNNQRSNAKNGSTTQRLKEIAI